MALKLQDFMSEIRSLGVQRSNRFRFEMDPPPTLQLGGTSILSFLGDLAETGRSRQLSLRCQTVTFPGLSLMTKDDVLRYGYGPVDKTAHGALFGDINVFFVADGKGLIQEFFNKWQMSVVNFDSSESMSQERQGAAPYEVSYKDDYVTTIDISQLDERNRTNFKLTAQKAFPIVVGDLQFSADAIDQVQLLPVTFSYRDHRIRRPTNLL
jgi:hypothetical protein